MKEEARIKEITKKIEDMDQLLKRKKWQDVVNQAEDVTAQLEKLAKQSTEGIVKISDMLQKVKRIIVMYVFIYI